MVTYCRLLFVVSLPTSRLFHHRRIAIIYLYLDYYLVIEVMNRLVSLGLFHPLVFSPLFGHSRHQLISFEQV